MSDVKFTLSDDPKAKAIYAELKKDGVSLKDVDLGYYDLTALSEGKQPPFVGKGDGVVQPQEVYNFVLSNYGKYKRLLAEKTGIYYPYALPPAARRTPLQQKFYDDLKSFVKYTKSELAKAGVGEDHPRHDEAVVSALMAVIGGKGERVIYDDSMKRLAEIGAAGVMKKLEKKAARLFEGGRECSEVLPLDKYLNKECGLNGGLAGMALLRAIYFAGLKPRMIMGVTADIPGLSFSTEVTDASGKMVYRLSEDYEWKVDSPRLSLGGLYLITILMEQQLTGENTARWVEGAMTLMPDLTFSREMYAKWLLNRSDAPDPAAAEKEIRLVLEMNPQSRPAVRFALADALMKQGKFDEAIVEFEGLLEIEIDAHSRAKALSDLGRCLVGAGRSGDAVGVLKERMSMGGGSAFAAYWLAMAHIDLKENEEAKAAFEEALVIDPEATDVHKDYFVLSLMTGDYEKAKSLAARAYEIDPSDPHVLRMMSVSSRIDKDYEKALEYVHGAIAKGLDDPKTRILEGMAYYFMGRGDEAEKSFRMAIGGDSEINTHSHLMLAHIFYSRGDLKEARGEIDQVDTSFLLMEDDRLEYEVIAGLIKANLDDLDSAEVHLLKSLDYAEGEYLAMSHGYLYYLYRNRGDKAKAADMLRKMKQVAKDEPDVYAYVGQIHMHYNEYKKAFVQFAKVPAQAKMYDYSRWQMAAASGYLKKWDKAKAYAEELIASCDKQRIKSYAYAIRGEAVRVREKDLAAAYGDFEKAVELDIPWAHPYLMLTEKRVMEKDLDGARALVEKAVALEPNNASAHWVKSSLALCENRPEEAMKDIERAMELGPDEDMKMALLYNRGVAKMSKHDYSGALEDLKGAEKLYRNEAEYQAMLGMILYEIADHKSAAKALTSALGKADAAMKEDEVLHLYRFMALAAFDVEDAEGELEWLREGAANKEILYLAEARYAIAKGDVSTAKKFAGKAVGENADSVVCHNLLGIIYATEGDVQKARKEFEKALEIDPSYDSARENLEVIRKDEGLKFDWNKYLLAPPPDMGVGQEFGPGFVFDGNGPSSSIWDSALRPYSKRFKQEQEGIFLFRFGEGGFGLHEQIAPLFDPDLSGKEKLQQFFLEDVPGGIHPYIRGPLDDE